MCEICPHTYKPGFHATATFCLCSVHFEQVFLVYYISLVDSFRRFCFSWKAENPKAHHTKPLQVTLKHYLLCLYLLFYYL